MDFFAPLQILLVDDSPADARLVSFAVEESTLNAELTSVHGASEAIDYLISSVDESGKSSVDFVLLDLNMPGMGGHECLQLMRRSHLLRDIPVFVMSASSSKEDMRRAYDQGIDAYLVKPGGFLDLVDIFDQFEDYWRQSESVRRPA